MSSRMVECMACFNPWCHQGLLEELLPNSFSASLFPCVDDLSSPTILLLSMNIGLAFVSPRRAHHKVHIFHTSSQVPPEQPCCCQKRPVCLSINDSYKTRSWQVGSVPANTWSCQSRVPFVSYLTQLANCEQCYGMTCDPHSKGWRTYCKSWTRFLLRMKKIDWDIARSEAQLPGGRDSWIQSPSSSCRLLTTVLCMRHSFICCIIFKKHHRNGLLVMSYTPPSCKVPVV